MVTLLPSLLCIKYVVGFWDWIKRPKNVLSRIPFQIQTDIGSSVAWDFYQSHDCLQFLKVLGIHNYCVC